MQDASITHAPTRLKLLIKVLAVSSLFCLLVNGTYFWWKSTQRSQGIITASASTSSPVAESSQSKIAQAEASQIEQQEQWLLLHPEDREVRLELARYYFVNEQFASAIKHLLVARAQRPRDPEVILRLSMAYKQNEQTPEALTAIQAALKINPTNVTFRQWLGEVYLAQGRSEDALHTFEQCLKKDAKSYEAWLGKGKSLEQLYISQKGVDARDIVKSVEQAIKLQPYNVQGLTILARMTFHYLAQLDKAEALAQRAIKINPTLVEPHLLLAQIYLKAPTPEHLEKAEAAAQTATHLDRTRPGPLYTLARVQMQKGKTREAIQSLEKSIAIQSLPEAVYMLSQAYSRVGKIEKSKQYGAIYAQWNGFMEKRKALLGQIQYNPEDINSYCNLAELYLSTGSYAPAENWLRKAQYIQKNHPRVRKLLAGLAKHKHQAKVSMQTPPR